VYIGAIVDFAQPSGISFFCCFLFKLFYPDSTPVPPDVRHHHQLQRYLLGLTLSDLTWHRNETRSSAIVVLTGIASVNKLASLTWVLCMGAEKYSKIYITLHYIVESLLPTYS